MKTALTVLALTTILGIGGWAVVDRLEIAHTVAAMSTRIHANERRCHEHHAETNERLGKIEGKLDRIIEKLIPQADSGH
jgi:hypothetical protein